MTWQSAMIYGVAALAALQGLFALMTAHRKASLRRFLEEESRKEIESAKQPEPSPADAGRTSHAA